MVRFSAILLLAACGEEPREEDAPPTTAWEALPHTACDAPSDSTAFTEIGDGGDWGAQRIISSEDLPTTAWGVVVADLNGDDHEDIYLPHFGPGELFLGDGRGGLARVDLVPSEEFGATMSAVAVDVDGDGDLDIVESGYATVRPLYNDGTGTMVLGEPLVNAPDRMFLASSWADADGDGDLDVYLPSFPAEEPDGRDFGPGIADILLRNDGGGVFVDISELLPESNDGHTFGGGFLDLEGDGVPELVSCNDHGAEVRANQVWVWDGERYTDHPDEALKLALDCMGLAAGDLNGDRYLDVAASGWGNLRLAESDGSGGWFSAGAARTLWPEDTDRQRVAWGMEAADIDNDGDLDLAVRYGEWELYTAMEGPSSHNPADQPDALFLQQPDGTFTDEAAALGVADTGIGRGLAVADLNEDGFPDLITRRIHARGLVHLSACTDQSWLSVRLTQPGPNPDAIGAQVTVRAGDSAWHHQVRAGGTSFASSSPPAVHVGLGGEDVVDALEITWPDGETTVLEGIPARQRIRVRR